MPKPTTRSTCNKNACQSTEGDIGVGWKLQYVNIQKLSTCEFSQICIYIHRPKSGFFQVETVCHESTSNFSSLVPVFLFIWFSSHLPCSFSHFLLADRVKCSLGFCFKVWPFACSEINWLCTALFLFLQTGCKLERISLIFHVPFQP